MASSSNFVLPIFQLRSIIVIAIFIFVFKTELAQASRHRTGFDGGEELRIKTTSPKAAKAGSFDKWIKTKNEKNALEEGLVAHTNGSSKHHLHETASTSEMPSVKLLTKKAKGIDSNALRCARSLAKNKIVFEGQTLSNWKCDAVYDEDPISANKRLIYCACQHDYDCSETEQYYFDFATVTEQFLLENKVDLNAYTNYCENRIGLATNAVWSCKVTEETLNAYEDYHSQQQNTNHNSPYDNETYCECKTKKTCIYQKLVWNRPPKGKVNERALRDDKLRH